MDKYKISKAFFVKTNQEDCAYLAPITASEASTAATVVEGQETQETTEEHVRNVSGQLSDSVLPNEHVEGLIDNEKISQKVETVPERILKVADLVNEDKLSEKLTKEENLERKTNLKKVDEKLKKKEEILEVAKESKKTSP